MGIPRQTFVLHVHEDGGTVLEDVATHERVLVDRLVKLGDVVERRLQQRNSAELRQELNAKRGGSAGRAGPEPGPDSTH